MPYTNQEITKNKLGMCKTHWFD